MSCSPTRDATDGSAHRRQRGIGRAVAEQLLANGHRLCLGLRDPAVSGTPLESERVLSVPYDAGQPEHAEALVDAAIHWAGGADALIIARGFCIARRCCSRTVKRPSLRSCGGSM